MKKQLSTLKNFKKLSNTEQKQINGGINFPYIDVCHVTSSVRATLDAQEGGYDEVTRNTLYNEYYSECIHG
ncbi:hypothetical protein [Aquimarina rhabdastrellae]